MDKARKTKVKEKSRAQAEAVDPAPASVSSSQPAGLTLKVAGPCRWEPQPILWHRKQQEYSQYLSSPEPVTVFSFFHKHCSLAMQQPYTGHAKTL